MKTIELYHYGVDSVLSEINSILNQGVNSNSKKQKNEALREALGAIMALRDLIVITDNDNEDEECEGTSVREEE